MMVIAFIFLNLFIAVILQGFNETSEQINMCLDSAEIDKFTEGWALLDPQGSKFIKCEQFEILLKWLVSKKSPLVPFGDLVVSS